MGYRSIGRSRAQINKMTDECIAESIVAQRLTLHFAAEVRGIDLSQPLSDSAFARIRTFFLEHAVLIFRNQTLDDGALLAFTARFGTMDVHHLAEHRMTAHPEIRILTNDKKGGKYVGAHNAGMVWHTDQSFKERPMLATFLLGDDCPPEGADTQFASTAAAYAALPAEKKRELDGLVAVHDRNFSYAERYPERPPLTPEQLKEVPPVAHPLVRRHPETGRPGLFLALSDIRDIEGLDRETALRLIRGLVDFATRDEFVYSHKWRNGDLVVWDNRCTMHRATPYDQKYRRFMRRTQVKGDRPIAAHLGE